MHHVASPSSRPSTGRFSSILGLVALLGLTVVLAGCGYALVGRGSNIPEDVRTVYVEPFENRTQRQRVGQLVTETLSDELVRRRRLELVNAPGGADSLLTGSVVGFNLVPISFASDGRATEYEVSIIARVVFERVPDETVIWSNNRYQFRENYTIDELGGSFANEDAAIEEAARRFAETVVSDLFEGF